MLKGRVQPKKEKLLSLFNHPHIVPNQHAIICFSVEHKTRDAIQQQHNIQ